MSAAMFRSYGTVYVLLALLAILWAAIIALAYEIGTRYETA